MKALKSLKEFLRFLVREIQTWMDRMVRIKECGFEIPDF
jgi:hypothetical protein